MSRIPLTVELGAPRPTRPIRAALWFSRRMYGDDLDSARALGRHPGSFWPWVLMEALGGRRRTALPGHLDHLVQFVTAASIGCSWCVDFGAALWEKEGLDPAILREALTWRESTGFDDDTRAALAFAETASADVREVTDDMVADLRERFGDTGVVELAHLVALENMRARFNASLGLTAQGFSSGACVIPIDRAG